MVYLLFKRGAAINQANGSRSSPLRAAMANGYLNVVKLLVGLGADVESTNDEETPLYAAYRKGYVRLVQVLMAAGASATVHLAPGKSPLFDAAKNGHLKVVESCSRTTSWSMEILEALVEAGCSANVRSQLGETPLISAARSDFPECVQLLIAKGGAVNVKEVADREYPLLPGTLEKMTAMCSAAHEFAGIAIGIKARLDSVCCQLEPGESSLVTFADVVFQFCRLLFELEALDSPLSRFIANRPLSTRLRDVHEELDRLCNLRDYEQSTNDWGIQWDEAQRHQSNGFLKTLSNYVVLANGYIKFPDASILLQQQIGNRGGQSNEEELTAARHVLERLVQVCRIDAPVVPENSVTVVGDLVREASFSISSSAIFA